jgi:hypothetical protein
MHLQLKTSSGFNSDAESASKKILVFGWTRKADAGAMGDIGRSKHAFIAGALRRSGPMHKIYFAFRSCGIEMLMACLGTCSTDANQPSPICCLR